MPSPVGHALAGVAAGWLVAGPADDRRARLHQAAILSAVALAPDLDLLIGRHSAETHSLGAAAIVATIAWWRNWPVAAGGWRVWLAVFLAWATHPLLDSLGSDTSVPIGVMAFWPFSREYVQTGLDVFLPIYRRWMLPGFVSHNFLAMLRELAILLPFTALAWWAGGGPRSKSAV
jgi:membrane-bound metal-dependent hydrolase YbcI (DUF457 family)